ncbi:unnamed protein product, partial [Symbiodinium pilosum]
MRAVGPYWDTLRHRHLMPSEYCYYKGLLQELWDAGAVELCLHANAATMNRYSYINVPWFCPEHDFDLGFYPPSEREILANFIGSASVHQPSTGNGTRDQYLLAANRIRWRTVQGMVRCGPDCHVAMFHRARLQNASDTEDYVQAARRLIGFTIFNILPPGDGLARSTREQTVAVGSIPVMLDFPDSTPFAQEFPFSEVIDWSNFSLNFKLVSKAEIYGFKSYWPRLEKTLREM